MSNGGENNEPGGLKGALQQLKDAITDLTELHVRTMSGSIKIQTDADGDVDMSAMTAAAGQDDVEIVADTVIKFDGDAYYFVKDNAPEKMLESHRKAVETSMNSRRAIVEMFKDQLL